MSAKNQPAAYQWCANNNFHSSESDLAHSLVNEAAYLGKPLTMNVGVPGRLSSSSEFGDFYENVLLADQETIAIVRYGYVVPFEEIPPKAQFTRNY